MRAEQLFAEATLRAKKAMGDPDTVVIVIDSIPQQGEK